jgi:hypothetical protein
MGMNSRRGNLAKTLLLAGSLLIRFDTLEVVVYVEPGTEVRAPADFVARQACPVLQSMQLALPTAYRIQWGKQLPTGGAAPDESKVVTGMLTTCERT